MVQQQKSTENENETRTMSHFSLLPIVAAENLEQDGGDIHFLLPLGLRVRVGLGFASARRLGRLLSLTVLQLHARRLQWEIRTVEKRKDIDNGNMMRGDFLMFKDNQLNVP